MSDTLEVLERRVGEKWAAAVEARAPSWPISTALDVSAWIGTTKELPSGTLQFPREQWVSCPLKRMAALIYCEHLLDRATELTDEQWIALNTVMLYGGNTRIA